MSRLHNCVNDQQYWGEGQQEHTFSGTLLSSANSRPQLLPCCCREALKWVTPGMEHVSLTPELAATVAAREAGGAQPSGKLMPVMSIALSLAITQCIAPPLGAASLQAALLDATSWGLSDAVAEGAGLKH